MSIPSKRAHKRTTFLDFIRKSFNPEDAAELERQLDETLAASDEEEATDDIMAENEALRSANEELEAKVAELQSQIDELNEKLKDAEAKETEKSEEEAAAEEEAAIDEAIDDAIEKSCGTDEVIKKHFTGLVDRSKISYNRETKEVSGLAEQMDIISKSFTDLSAALGATVKQTVPLPKASGAKSTSTPKTVSHNMDSWD